MANRAIIATRRGKSCDVASVVLLGRPILLSWLLVAIASIAAIAAIADAALHSSLRYFCNRR
jgi:hypothetical protein